VVDSESSSPQIGRVTAVREIAGPPEAPASGVFAVQATAAETVDRAALYVDGFNFYHAVDGLGKSYLKWVSLWRLGELIIPSRTQRLVKVVYCTAFKKGDPAKIRRHSEYIMALEHSGVSVVRGHFIEGSMDCRGCGRIWNAPQEKESDVNLALSVLDDAYQDVFDHAYLLTADSDQGATVRMMSERFSSKSVTSVAPPGMEPSKSITKHTSLRLKLSESHVERCLLPSVCIETVDGKPTLRYRRPKEYDTPPGFRPL
jgi:hypothetical protein